MALPLPRLVPQQIDHAAGLYRALIDPRIYAFLDDAPPASVDAVRKHIERVLVGGPKDGSERWLNWSVFQGETIVGFTQATVLSEALASIAYVFSPTVWGTGLAQTAVELTASDLADSYGITTLIADTEEGNLASQRLLVRMAFAETRRSDGDIHYIRAVKPLSAMTVQ